MISASLFSFPFDVDQPPSLEAEFSRLLGSLRRVDEKLAGKEISVSMLSGPGVRVSLRRGRKLLRQLLDASDGEQAPDKKSSGRRRTSAT